MNLSFPRYPARLNRQQFYPVAYEIMFYCHVLDEKIYELFRKGYVKGTVIICIGNEATMVPMSMPFRPGQDILGLMHRDMGGHLVNGMTPYELLCQYMANAQSPTHAREGNVHHGNVAQRRLPFISHLGNTLAPVVGATWAARRNGEDVFGLASIGDGGSSTGDFHESLNLASVQRVPVLFVVENNHYAYSTPTRLQYNAKQLSDRAAGYNIPGKTIDGTDAWEVYCAVNDALDEMNKTSLPYLLESMTLRLYGHAAYDKAEYVSAAERQAWLRRDPVARARAVLLDECEFTEEKLGALESAVRARIDTVIARSLSVGRPACATCSPGAVFAPARPDIKLPPFTAPQIKNLQAVTAALDYIMGRDDKAVLLGMDIGVYGSAFKTCKGLYERYGAKRVMDMPVCESGIVGFALGASQFGARPIIEYQFADFSTEAATQMALNAASWYFRSCNPAPLVFRLPCGGGITLGAFHSGEFEGIWSRFPGLKLLYPFTPQETFEAIVAAYYDPNPCLVFEHKLLYASKGGSIDFNGDMASIWRPRQYAEGADCTIVAFGAMNELALAVVSEQGYSADVWNPFILNPLDIDPLAASVEKTGRLLVIQESGETAGLGDRIVSLIVKRCFAKLRCAPAIVASPDMPVPFAPELETATRPDKNKIRAAIEQIIGEKS
ncbi:MAG: thiamine pyrophosphate-dependent enzyme [Chitinivibrionales bacterium]|nr:thiamine pyrophosphate-dependent enzyme [Chitinivibrionales bacterium]